MMSRQQDVVNDNDLLKNMSFNPCDNQLSKRADRYPVGKTHIERGA